MAGHVTSTPIQRFIPKVLINNPEDCWEWIGGISGVGYGMFWTGKRVVAAHRWWLERFFWRDLKSNELVCHHCDNRRCVNLEHLYLGDHSTNNRDAAKRRRSRGTKKTHCPRGHPYSSENTYVLKGERYGESGWRYCRACRRTHNKEAIKARKANGDGSKD